MSHDRAPVTPRLSREAPLHVRVPHGARTVCGLPVGQVLLAGDPNDLRICRRCERLLTILKAKVTP